jgi:hypothetical protein
MFDMTMFKRLHWGGLILGALALYLIKPESASWSTDMSAAIAALSVNGFFLAKIHWDEHIENWKLMRRLAKYHKRS